MGIEQWASDVGEARREILVVDDMPEIGDLFVESVRRMTHAGARVTVELSAERAFLALRHGDFDLVVADARLPGADGVEVLRVAHDLEPRAVRVLMSGYVEFPGPFERLAAAELHAYLEKPIGTGDIARLFGELLEADDAARSQLRTKAIAFEQDLRANGRILDGPFVHGTGPARDGTGRSPRLDAPFR